MQLQRRRGEREQQPGGDGRREERPAEDAVDDRAPDPALAVVAAEPADERDAQPVDLVAEPREQRREHGQRAEHGGRDDEDRGEAERLEGRVAGQEHAGHRGDHGQPGDQHGAAGGGGGGLEGGGRAASGGAFLACALQVEHRVVDADREADQEHHRLRLERDWEQVARQRDQPERREHGGQTEQERDAGRDECAEGQQEDQERDRQREHPGLAEVVPVRRLDFLLGAREAELADREAGVSALRGGDARDDRLDLVDGLVAVAADVEQDERGVPVLRDRAPADVLHVC